MTYFDISKTNKFMFKIFQNKKILLIEIEGYRGNGCQNFKVNLDLKTFKNDPCLFICPSCASCGVKRRF